MLALDETGVQSLLEAVGDGKHEDNGDRSDVTNDVIVAALMEKGARDVGDKHKERWADVGGDGGTNVCSTTCDEKGALVDGDGRSNRAGRCSMVS